MNLGICEHLDDDTRVKLGAYYTPSNLVVKVHELVAPYTGRAASKRVVIDTTAGYGAFIEDLEGEVRAIEVDDYAIGRLHQVLPAGSVFRSNSLKEPVRARYGVAESDTLIVVGNPPYNDTTSEFRNGRKGTTDADPDLADRDLGISFLRSYNRLRADVVCVLHPLSYLIKRANFLRLKDFREHYRLRRGLLFSSARFGQTGGTKFPVVIALYERGEGMDYENVRNFNFELLDEKGTFHLANFETTDGLINKYPPRASELRQSDIGLYHYTFRDINSLKRNAGFMDEPHPNGIVVHLRDFYRYAYLHAFKRLFAPPNAWLYGNLSPLVDQAWLEETKRDLVAFALGDHPVLARAKRSLIEGIADHYGSALRSDRGEALREKLQDGIMKLARV